MQQTAWLWLLAAGAVEIAMAISLKFAQGWTRPIPSVLGIVTALLKAGANPNAADSAGNTPLHVAAKKKKHLPRSITKLLLDKAAHLVGQFARDKHNLATHHNRHLVAVTHSHAAGPQLLPHGRRVAIQIARIPVEFHPESRCDIDFAKTNLRDCIYC